MPAAAAPVPFSVWPEPEPAPLAATVISYEPDPLPPPTSLPVPVGATAVALAVPDVLDAPQPSPRTLPPPTSLPVPVGATAVASAVAETVVEPQPRPQPRPQLQPVARFPPDVPAPVIEGTSRPPQTARPARPERPPARGVRRVVFGAGAVAFGAVCVAVATTLFDGDEDGAQPALPPAVITQPATEGAEAPSTIETPTTPVPSPTSAPPTAAPSSAPIVVPPTEPAPSSSVPPATTAAAVTTAPANTTPVPGATVFDGTGNFVIELAGLDLAGTVVVVTHSGSAAFELSALDADLNQLQLVESAAGAVVGTYPLGIGALEVPSYLRVDADGAWHIEIQPVDATRTWNADLMSGTGPDVVRFEGGASVLDYTNSGASNFIVEYYRDAGFDLLVNEIGPISGSTTMQSGPGVVVVDAEGEWALSARPA